MIPLTLADLLRATGATGSGVDVAVVATGVSIDSRAVRPGDLFVAIHGERHDGHDHVAQALAAGAVAAVVSRPVDGPTLLVDDTVVALGRVARELLDHLPACQVVGITGSSGKTSTKDLVARVLSDIAPTVSPPGSFNNEVGLPTTVLQADLSTRFLVAEMGMRGRGHIAYLCGIAPPSVAVVTNVGSAHLELLGSKEAIAEAKSEIVQALPPAGVAVLNHDDHRVMGMRARTSARVLTYGESAGSDVRAESVRLDDLARASFGLRHGGEVIPVSLRLHGRHQVWNALAAASVGLAVGASLEQVAVSLAEAQPDSRWRMEVTRSPAGTVIINDAYNANPESMDAALTALATMADGRTSWAVVGEMREIGEASAREHRRVGERVAELGIDRLVVVGEGARPAVGGAEGALGDRVAWVPDVEAAIALLGPAVGPDDVVLVKASRAIGLERVAVALCGPPAGKDGAL